MQDLLNLFKQPGVVNDDFDSIRVSIASPEKIRSWSFGEVSFALNYLARSMTMNVCVVNINV